MKRMWITAVWIAMITFTQIAPAAIISTFDTDADGWTHGAGDPNSHVVWQPTGGNPGGCLTLEDQAAGNTDYWSAPPKFLGNQLGAYLGTLSFDLKINPAGTVFSDLDVRLFGGGHSVYGLMNISPTDSYNHFNILLQEGPQWYYDGTVFGPPSQDKFLNILSNLTALDIRADYLNLGEVDSIDNITLTPEPGLMTFAAAGILVAGGRGRRQNIATRA